MLRFPNAKINLGLHITRKRDDGFHDLETVFYPVPAMRDALELVPARGAKAEFHQSGLPVGGDESTNLVWRAVELVKNRFPGKLPLVDIYLHKAIPMGAGLGGGSADAAFALKMLNELGALAISDNELEAMALELGKRAPRRVENTDWLLHGKARTVERRDTRDEAHHAAVIYQPGARRPINAGDQGNPGADRLPKR